LKNQVYTNLEKKAKWGLTLMATLTGKKYLKQAVWGINRDDGNRL